MKFPNFELILTMNYGFAYMRIIYWLCSAIVMLCYHFKTDLCFTIFYYYFSSEISRKLYSEKAFHFLYIFLFGVAFFVFLFLAWLMYSRKCYAFFICYTMTQLNSVSKLENFEEKFSKVILKTVVRHYGFICIIVRYTFQP